METRLRPTPWSSWESWRRVHCGLFSEDPGDRRNALWIIEAWKSRGKVPVAVENTAVLVQIMLDDPYFTPCSHRETLDSLRSRYAMAIIRSVNALTDSAQKGSVAASVESLGRSLGIPSWIVDIRHEATHSPNLPSLEALRLAADFMLKFFLNGYWTNQLHACVQPDEEPTFSDEQMLSDFIERRERTPKGAKDLSVRDESVAIKWIVRVSKGLVSDEQSAVEWFKAERKRGRKKVEDEVVLPDDTQRLLSSFKFLVDTLASRMSETFMVELIEAILLDPCPISVAVLATETQLQDYIQYRSVKVAASSNDATHVGLLTPLMELPTSGRRPLVWVGVGNCVHWETGKVLKSFK
jgi:hypothetical protein